MLPLPLSAVSHFSLCRRLSHRLAFHAPTCMSCLLQAEGYAVLDFSTDIIRCDAPGYQVRVGHVESPSSVEILYNSLDLFIRKACTPFALSMNAMNDCCSGCSASKSATRLQYHSAWATPTPQKSLRETTRTVRLSKKSTSSCSSLLVHMNSFN